MQYSQINIDHFFELWNTKIIHEMEIDYKKI